MNKNGEFKQNFFSIAIIISLMILFGTVARANAATSYVIYPISGQSFSGASNSTLATKSFSVNDTSPIDATFTAMTDQPWLSISHASPTTAWGSSVAVAVNTAGLAAGTYTGHVIITVPNQSGYTWTNSPYSVPVTLTVTSGTVPTNTAETIRAISGLSFSGVSNSALAAKSFSVSDSNSIVATFTARTDQPWLSISSASPTTASGATVAAAVNTTGLAAGTYTGHVIITIPNQGGYTWTNSPYSVPVTLTVTSGTTPTGTPETIYPISGQSFSGASNSTLATKSFSVNDTSPIDATFTARTDQPWLSISHASPTTAWGSSVAVAVNTAGLAAGTYTGHVIITVPNQGGYTWTNSPYPVPVTLTVTSGTAVAPAITSQPASSTVAAGKTATFNVAATGTSPMTYQWAKNGGAIGGATTSSYTTPATTMSDNNAQFTVTLNNSMGTATSNAAVLTVTAAAVAPSITTQPASQTVIAGKAATFNVAATGTSPMTYQWSTNGAPISGATSSSYSTTGTTSNNNATFTVAVTNSAGSATSNAAVLTVTAAAVAPSITSQPASQTVIAGKTATFTVAATGTSTLTYQWSMNGAPISGATSSSYSTVGTTSNNNATFTVTVTNGTGSATSNAATLTVSPSTLTLNSSSTSLGFGSVNVSSNSTQNVTLTNAGNSTITITSVTVSGAGFTSSGVSGGLILNPGQSATLTATFAPSATGSATGGISVASNATNSPDNITLSGTGVATVTHSASLTWTADTSSVIGYNAYSSTTSGGPYTKLNSAPATSTAYTDSTVQTGLTYYYVVTAVAAGGVESPYSNEISAVIP